MISSWTDIISEVYEDYIEYNNNENVDYEMTLKALEMLSVLFNKLITLQSQNGHVSVLFNLLKLTNKIGYNSLYDSITSQYLKFELEPISLAITKVTRNGLSQCQDLELNISWPSSFDETTDSSQLSCIIASINAPASTESATENMKILTLADIAASDRLSLQPISISTTSSQSMRRILQNENESEDECESIKFLSAADSAFTATFAIQ